jgi:hypothetical protein
VIFTLEEAMTPTANLNANAGQPTVRILVGYAHWAKYELWLRDPSDTNPQLIAQGVNTGVNPNEYPIPIPNNGTLANLNGYLIFWRAAVASADENDQNPVYVLVQVMQGGGEAGRDEETGTLTDPPPYGFIRLAVS